METFNYPDGCPVCIAKAAGDPNAKIGKGRMHQLIAKMQEGGFYSKDLLPCSAIGIHVNLDPRHIPLIGARIPAFRSYEDICEECGAVFTIRQEVGHVAYTGKPHQPFENLA